MGKNFSAALDDCGGAGMTPPDLLPFCECGDPVPRLLTTDVPSVKHVPSWVPGAWWPKYAERWRFAIQDMLNVGFNQVKEQMV
jgi:hypothetical protein